MVCTLNTLVYRIQLLKQKFEVFEAEKDKESHETNFIEKIGKTIFRQRITSPNTIRDMWKWLAGLGTEKLGIKDSSITLTEDTLKLNCNGLPILNLDDKLSDRYPEPGTTFSIEISFKKDIEPQKIVQSRQGLLQLM